MFGSLNDVHEEVDTNDGSAPLRWNLRSVIGLAIVTAWLVNTLAAQFMPGVRPPDQYLTYAAALVVGYCFGGELLGVIRGKK